MNIRKIAAVTLISLLTACTSETEYGECIGINGDKDPTLVYHVSIWNVIVSVVFIETLVVPIVWALGYTHCPTEKKVDTK